MLIKCRFHRTLVINCCLYVSYELEMTVRFYLDEWLPAKNVSTLYLSVTGGCLWNICKGWAAGRGTLGRREGLSNQAENRRLEPIPLVHRPEKVVLIPHCPPPAWEESLEQTHIVFGLEWKTNSSAETTQKCFAFKPTHNDPPSFLSSMPLAPPMPANPSRTGHVPPTVLNRYSIGAGGKPSRGRHTCLTKLKSPFPNVTIHGNLEH
jgi:hypothetical protein